MNKEGNNISINFNFTDFVGFCSVVETMMGCYIGMIGYSEDSEGIISVSDVITYPEEDMIDGSFEEPVKDIVSIRKAFPLERLMYFKLWGEYKRLSSHRPAHDWTFSEDEITPFIGKLVVLDFYDAENIEDHYIGVLKSYDDMGLFSFTLVYDVHSNQLFRSLSVIDASFIRFPNSLEKSLYDKVVNGCCWIS